MRLALLTLPALLLAAACHRAPMNAGALPPSILSLPAPACGGLAALPRAESPSALLEGRLSIVPLAGTELLPRPGPLMGAPSPTDKETRLFLESGDDKLVIMAYELERLAGEDFLSSAPAWFQPAPGAPGPAWQTLTLPQTPGGLRQVVGWAETPILGAGDAVPALMGLARHPDGTAQLVIFYVTPAAATADGLGCTALALDLARSLEAGPRTLDRAGGEHSLAQLAGQAALTLSLPPDVLLSEQRGPDFTVFLAQPLLPISAGAQMMGIYIGDHPEDLPEGTPLAGTLLGQAVSWTTWTEGNPGELAVSRQELILPLPEGEGSARMLHVFLSADQPEDLPRLQALAETLAITPINN